MKGDAIGMAAASGFSRTLMRHAGTKCWDLDPSLWSRLSGHCKAATVGVSVSPTLTPFVFDVSYLIRDWNVDNGMEKTVISERK